MARIQTSEHLSHSLFPTCHLPSALIHLFFFFFIEYGTVKADDRCFKSNQGKKEQTTVILLFFFVVILQRKHEEQEYAGEETDDRTDLQKPTRYIDSISMYLYQEVLVNYKGISTTQEDLLKNKSYLEDLGFHVLYSAGTCLYLTKKETLQSQVL